MVSSRNEDIKSKGGATNTDFKVVLDLSAYVQKVTISDMFKNSSKLDL